MDFKKVESLVNRKVTFDLKKANDHLLRVNYKPGDDSGWLTFVIDGYTDEKELAAVIKREIDRKTQNNPFPSTFNPSTKMM